MFVSKGSSVYKILTQLNGENFEFCPDKKGEILNFDPVTSLKLLISPFLLGLFVNVARFARNVECDFLG